MCANFNMTQWLLLFALILKYCSGLRDVILTIEPKIVQRGNQSTLRCGYDLEGATLYSVKWYRGTHEFFRYNPSDNPRSKVFPYETMIDVDMNKSNSTQVVLRKIDFDLSGNFSCEVTTTEEPASTGTDVESMLVVELPEYPPAISVGREILDFGDTLRANCSAPPARPAATLTFLLNNITVAKTKRLSPADAQRRLWSDLSLKLLLSEFHFNHGRLILQCKAEIAGIYYEEVQLELESARHPVPERVSAAANSANFPSAHTALMQVFLFGAILVVKS